MAPKDDPEVAALKKEITDMIAKFQVRPIFHRVVCQQQKLCFY